jgi:glucokinase
MKDTAMPDYSYIVADIGGTNVRLAAYHGDHKTDQAQYSTKSDGALLNLIKEFASAQTTRPDIIVVAAAGPVADNRVTLTNAQQTLCGADLRTATGAAEAYIINDFAAAAWATHAPAPNDLIHLQGPATPPDGTRLVIGPGTGLGVGALAFTADGYTSIPGEGGHIGIGPRYASEVAIFDALRTLWPEVFFKDTLVAEAEALLSGTGLPYLYQAVAITHGSIGTAPDAPTLMATARDDTDPFATQTIALFKSHLAQASGDFALTFGAGAVFLVGGVAMKNPWLFDSDFVNDVRAGGRFSDKRGQLGLYLLNSGNFGLDGARAFARQRLAQRN